VAKALTDATRNPESQFAILLGAAEPFVTTFPSDVVENDDADVWVEVRLRGARDDDLLVTMGVTLQRATAAPGVAGGDNNNEWLISGLDWQDFRDKFYPGLSGREWLRAF
jgi:HSP20 family molecular chaperone IbpA